MVVRQQLVDSLADDEPDRLVAHLSALARIAKHAAEIFDTRSSDVMAKGIKLLTTPSDDEDVSDVLLIYCYLCADRYACSPRRNGSRMTKCRI